MVSPAGGGTDAGRSQRIPRLAGLFALRAGLILIAVTAASLTLFHHSGGVKAEGLDCPGGTSPFVANFVAPAGAFDPGVLPPEIAAFVSITVEPAPGSNVDLILVTACVPLPEGGPPLHVGPGGGVAFTTPTPVRGTPTPIAFTTPTTTPPTAAPATAVPTATAVSGAGASTGVRPPSTGDGGVARTDKESSQTFAYLALVGGLAIAVTLRPRAKRAADSGRLEDF
jgi:hypothetical protein